MKKLNKKTGKNKKGIWMLFLLLLCVTLLGSTAQAAKNKFVKRSGKTYYYNSRGKKVTGLKKIKRKYYYFDKKGVLYKRGWKTIKGKRYYFARKSGAAYIGVKKIGKKRYLFSSKGSRCGTGITKYKNKIYYTRKGVVQIGLKVVKGKRYCFASSGAARKGWFNYKNSRYYGTKSGVLKTGWMNYKGRQYYFDTKAVMQRSKWIGDKYVGKDGYVTKTKNSGDPTTDPSKPDPKPKPQPSPIDPSKPAGYIYNETLSNKIIADINKYRLNEGKPAFRKATNTLLKQSIIRASHSITNCITTGDRSELAKHGLGQIGLSSSIPASLVAIQPSGYMQATDRWIKSALHRADLLGNHDAIALAVVYTTIEKTDYEGEKYKESQVSVIATFGADQSDATYSVNGVNKGAYDMDKAPLYDFTIHRSFDFTMTKEYVANTLLKVPYTTWDKYLNYRLEK